MSRLDTIRKCYAHHRSLAAEEEKVHRRIMVLIDEGKIGNADASNALLRDAETCLVTAREAMAQALTSLGAAGQAAKKEEKP